MELIGDAPYLTHVSYLMPLPHGHPGCRLYPGASQDLAVALYIHKQHTKIYSQTVNLHMSLVEITHSIIFTNQILDKVFHPFEHKVYQLTITQRLSVI
jgi:hypothetical protein